MGCCNSKANVVAPTEPAGQPSAAGDSKVPAFAAAPLAPIKSSKENLRDKGAVAKPVVFEIDVSDLKKHGGSTHSLHAEVALPPRLLEKLDKVEPLTAEALKEKQEAAEKRRLVRRGACKE